MAEVPNHKSTVTSVRKKYGPTLTNDQCVELCNEVAWIHREEGFGVAEKTAGTHGVRRDGRKCAIDGLVFRQSTGAEQFIDILGNADGDNPPAAVPSWQVYETSNRKWVAPIVPVGTPPDPPPTDPPGSEPPTDPPPPSTDYVTKAELVLFAKGVDQKFAELRAEMLRLHGEQQAALESQAQSIAELKDRKYVVRGRTGQSTFHSHPVDLPVELL